MPKLTHRQWDEYKAIIKKCQTLEIEALSNRALKAQVATLTAERDAAIKAACELFAFDNSAHKHWEEYTPATRELLLRQTDKDIAAALAAIKDQSHA